MKMNVMKFKLTYYNVNFLNSYIDEGKNPLLYTKDCLMKTLKKNEEIKGKIVTFSSFRELLLDELNKNFPEEYQNYNKIRQPDIQTNQVPPSELIKKEEE